MRGYNARTVYCDQPQNIETSCGQIQINTSCEALTYMSTYRLNRLKTIIRPFVRGGSSLELPYKQDHSIS